MVAINDRGHGSTDDNPIGDILETIALSEDLSNIDVMITEMILESSDRKCNCAKCQQYFWEKDDKVNAGILFRENEEPLFVLLPPHHKKVKKLIELNKELEEQNADLVQWKKIIKCHDGSTFGEISESGKTWLRRVAVEALDKVKINGQKDAKNVVKRVRTLQDFVSLMTGDLKFENEVFKQSVENICKNAIKDVSPKIQKKIDEIKTNLPEDYHNATEPLEIRMPLEELEAVIKNYVATQKEN